MQTLHLHCVTDKRILFHTVLCATIKRLHLDCSKLELPMKCPALSAAASSQEVQSVLPAFAEFSKQIVLPGVTVQIIPTTTCVSAQYLCETPA